MRAEADFAASFARVIVEWGVGAEGDGNGDGTDGFDSENPRCAALRSDVAEVLAALAVDEVERGGDELRRVHGERGAAPPCHRRGDRGRPRVLTLCYAKNRTDSASVGGVKHLPACHFAIHLGRARINAPVFIISYLTIAFRCF